MIYLSADWHLGHNKSFIYEPRGFMSAWENVYEIIRRCKQVLTPQDDLYLLGDTLMGHDNEEDKVIAYIAELPCRIHLIWGNHDTDRRKVLLSTLLNVVETLNHGTMFKYDKWHFLFSHYPTLTANYDDYEKPLKYRVWNLHGHTHDKNKFQFMDKGWQSYNVAVDAHNCYPVSIETIMDDIRGYYSKRGNEIDRVR